ncbi:TerD family protein [Streptomyces sp. TS71-3]|uniref:TerD family protein n=1 Tax=Streptomyces sp. TS71-3 TaxID=2733862 RepID=UPI001B16D814|nr:TerD family protein [Streptomyces sp. TS71-3]GHJ38335.1 export associated protein [Streptomyces sp. TS71-3]
MAAELVRGENHPLTRTRLEIRVSAGSPLVAGAALGDERGRLLGPDRLVHPGSPALPGLEVSQQAAAVHRLAVDLDALNDTVHRVSVLLALPHGVGGPARFGAVAAPFVAVTGLDGTELATYTITGLDTESAVVAVELYRRQGAWKVRAVGQGYAGGLPDLLADQGLDDASRRAADIHEAVARGLARAVAAPPSRPQPDSRTPATAQGSPAGGRDTAGTGRDAAVTAGAPPALTPLGAQAGPEAVPPASAGPEGSAAVESPAGPEGPVRPEGPARPDAAGEPSAGGSAAGAHGAGSVDYTHPARVGSAPPVPSPSPSPTPSPSAPPDRPAPPVAGDATGWTMDERLYNQVWGMFEDLARSTAAYRSAVGFADSRRGQEMDKAFADPRNRMGGAGDTARAAAEERHASLVDQARQALDRDLAQLIAESEVVEPALPVAYARWDNPVWDAYRVPDEAAMAVRLGDLYLPESAGLRIPLLVRLPLARGLWIDCGQADGGSDLPMGPDEVRSVAAESAAALAARLLAVHPARAFDVHIIDPAGTASGPLGPLLRSGVLSEPPAAGAAAISAMLTGLTRRVDLVQMAEQGGAADALPPGVGTAEHLLVVHDFPHGFDDRAVHQLRYLADEGPAVGVHLLLIGAREDALGYGPLLDPLWRSLLRLTPVPDDHLVDPWVGHAWTYEPLRVPPGSQVLQQVLARMATARHPWNR